MHDVIPVGNSNSTNQNAILLVYVTVSMLSSVMLIQLTLLQFAVQVREQFCI